MLFDGLLQVLSSRQLTSLKLGCLEKSYNLATTFANFQLPSTLLELSLLMKGPPSFIRWRSERRFEGSEVDLSKLQLPSSLTSLTAGDQVREMPVVRLPNLSHLLQLRELTIICTRKPAASFLRPFASLPRWGLMLSGHTCWWRMQM